MNMHRLSFVLSLLVFPFGIKAQWNADFESLPLSGPDTFYYNESQLGQDVGFQDGPAYFPTIYDSAWGTTFLSRGFVYSNLRDTVTGTYLNQFSSREGMGAQGSAQYAVCFGEENRISLNPAYRGSRVLGFYISNSTYAWHVMKYGDMGFGVEPFGGMDGQRPDWFKLVIRAYHGGKISPDSVEFYLADFRHANSSQDTIIRGWHWVNLLPLGPVDSLEFRLSSSDVGAFGINTPLYFCMDDFHLDHYQAVSPLRIPELRVFPNPFGRNLRIEPGSADKGRIKLYSVLGQLVLDRDWAGESLDLDMQAYPSGTYILEFRGQEPGQISTRTLIKSVP